MLVAGAATALSACAAGPARTARAAHHTVADPWADAMAEQTRRDVEQMRRLSRTRDEVAAVPPEIQWNDAATRGPPVGGALLPEAPPLPKDPPRRPVGHVRAGDEPAEPPVETVPVTTTATDRLDRLVVELSAELYREAAHSDMPLRQLLLMAAIAIQSPDRPFAPEALPGLTDRERDLLGRMHAFYVELGRELARSGDPEAVVRAVETLHRSLAVEPRLALPRVALCPRVVGFGDYDEFSRNASGHYTFLAQSGQQAVIYVEIEDFASELNDKGEWVTQLSQQLVIYSDSDGIPVWREDWQAGVDASRNKRADFFITQVITVPRRLSVGRYQLKIRIRDEQSGAESETAVEFEVVADPRMVGG